MRKVAASLVCLAFAVSTASAGTVSWTPAVGQEGGVTPGTVATFDLRVDSSNQEQFDTISLLIATDADISSVWSFAYDPTFYDESGKVDDLVTQAAPPPTQFFVFGSDLNIGGSRFANPAFVAPVLIGQLRIDTTGMLVGESIDFGVSSAGEIANPLLQFSLSGLATGGGAAEQVEGFGTLSIVPEPATLALLGIGGIATVLRRRRAA